MLRTMVPITSFRSALAICIWKARRVVARRVPSPRRLERSSEPEKLAGMRPPTAQPQHHLPTADLVGFTQLAVVLIAAVKLQQLNGIFREANVIVTELTQQRVAQMVAIQLALLCLGERLISVSATAKESSPT